MIQANVLGHLGADAEVKTINEKQYMTFRVASTEKRNGQDETTWVSVMSSVNENVLPYLKKGQQVFVSGRLSARIYQSQQNFGIDLSVFAQTLQLCGGKKEMQNEVKAVEQVESVQNNEPVFPPQQPDGDAESDLPF